MKIEQLLQELTIKEKIELLVGKDAWRTKNIDRLGIPSVFVADGPHGLRKVIDNESIAELTETAVCYPSLSTIASSFDPEVSKKMGQFIAKEFKSQGVNVILGPGVNIKRHPFCGRNFEYFSEDPVVTTKMAKGYIEGVKQENIGVCIKHYAMNSQETYRVSSNSVADDRAKYEIYYKAFRELVQLQPEMVMCSYNKVDGTYASENVHLLKEVLRDQFGFGGVIVSDWNAVSNRTSALIATLDLEMPGYIYGIHTLLQDYKRGKVSIEQIDESAARILKLAEQFKDQKIEPVNLETHHEVAASLAAESMVLLKNTDGVLPLHEDEKILLVGDMARHIRYQGGGSSHINSYKIDNILDHLIKHDKVDFYLGYLKDTDEIDSVLAKEVLEVASDYDKVVFVGGLTDEYESEGYDRDHLSMPKNQEYLIQALAKENTNIICVLQMGSPIVMPFIDHIKGLLNCYLGGEGLGIAVNKILFGEINPSGRLAESYPQSVADIPSHPYFAKGNNNVFYQESIYVGYRYYQTKNMKMLFPFGYGKSYSHFEYSNIRTNKKVLKNHDESLTIKIDITNNGPFDGKEVVMLFYEAKNPKTTRPKRELIDFEKHMIKNNETITVSFKIRMKDLAYYNINKGEFTTDDGVYHLQIMRNAKHMYLEIPIEVKSKAPYIESKLNELESYQVKGGLEFKDEDFAKLIGQEIKDQHVIHQRPFTINNNIEDIEHTYFGKILKKNLEAQLTEKLKDQTEDFKLMVMKSIYQMPLRFIALFSAGEVRVNFMKGFIALINRRYFKALKYLFRKD